MLKKMFAIGKNLVTGLSLKPAISAIGAIPGLRENANVNMQFHVKRALHYEGSACEIIGYIAVRRDQSAEFYLCRSEWKTVVLSRRGTNGYSIVAVLDSEIPPGFRIIEDFAEYTKSRADDSMIVPFIRDIPGVGPSIKIESDGSDGYVRADRYILAIIEKLLKK